MRAPLDSIQVGQCYLTVNGQVVRVLKMLPGEQFAYEFRPGTVGEALGWKSGVADISTFILIVERPVSCDCTPEVEPP